MIWFKDPMTLIDSLKVYSLLPTENMPYEEQHNSFIRFVSIFSVCTFLINKNSKMIFLPIFGGILSFIMYQIHQSENTETFDKFDENTYKCTKPEPNNPFMNVLLSDYESSPNKEKACDVTSSKVQHDMDKLFKNELFRSVDDIFDKNYSYRQFYTTPNTTIPNDQEAFAKWLYYTEDETCKEGNQYSCDKLLRK